MQSNTLKITEAKKLIDNLSDPVFILTKDKLKIISLNNKANLLFNLNHSSSGKQDFINLFPDNNKDQFKKNIEGENYSFIEDKKWELKTVNGNYISAKIKINQIDYQNNSAILLIISSENEKEEFEKTELKLSSIFDDSNDAIIGKTLDGIITNWNKAAEEMYGYTSDEVLGKSISIIVPENKKDELAEIMNKLRSGERVNNLITNRKRKDGKNIDVSVTISPIKNRAGELTGASAIARDITEQIKIQNELIGSRKRYEAIVESAMDGIITIDNEQKIILFNDAASDMFKYSANEVIGNPLDKLLPDRFREIHKDHIKNFGEKGITTRRMGALGKVSGKRKSGEEFPIEASISQVKFNDKKYFTVILRDITQRVIAEEKLKESEKRFRSMADSAPVLIWMTDTDMNYNFFNKTYLNFTGKSLEEEIDKGWSNGIHPDDYSTSLAIVQSSFNNRTEFETEYRLLHNSGEYRWILDKGIPRFSPDGQFEGYIGSCTDIHEIKRVEDELIKHSSYLKTLNKASQTFSESTTDYQGLLVKVAEYTAKLIPDSCLVRLLNEETNELEAVTFYDSDEEIFEIVRLILISSKLFPGDEKLTEEVFESGIPLMKKEFDIEEIRDKTKPEFWQMYEILSTNGLIVVPMIVRNKIIGLIYLFRRNPELPKFSDNHRHLAGDLAERAALVISNAILFKEIQKSADKFEQRVEERTKQLKTANSELENFSYSVSHDLKAPLRAVEGFSKILEEDYNDKLDDEGKRIISVIRNNTVQMGELINDLLQFSKMSRTEFQFQSVNMNELVNSIFNELVQLENNRNIEFIVNELLPVSADYSMIKIVWTNLISNAIKFTSKEKNTIIECGSIDNVNNIEYYLKDNGVGFDKKYSNKLFGVFQRLHSVRDFPGNGVGLAIVKRIIERHNGSISAHSKPGEGASFYFTIPKDFNYGSETG